MSMQDPISDLISRIITALAVGKKEIAMPASRVKAKIAEVLTKEGYILGSEIENREGKSWLVLQLKYYHDRPVIEYFKRISKPGLRIYKGKGQLPKVRGGLGIAVVSTSAGIMSDREARQIGVGGEILCVLY
jgi:small subunit ribosomal protein S8